MLAHSLLLALVGLILAAPDRDPSIPRPAPKANADPHDTNNPRLVGKRFEYDELPYKVDTFENKRGIQVGFNQCNSSTQGQTSMCQTLIVNSIDDFCLFIPPTRKVVGDAEAGMVAACTKEHGARLIPAGALTAVQFIRTKSYVEVTGRIHQELLNIPDGDSGGEVDSGGQDARGNPIGAMLYSNSLPFSKGTIKQSPVWHQFIGSDMFCLKACDVNAPNAMGLCEHVFDIYGCGVNVPAAYKENVFESCDGEDQKPVQPGVTVIPASSNCTPYQSSSLYASLLGGSGTATSTAITTGTTPTGTSSGRPTGTGSSTSPTGTSTRPGNAAPRHPVGGFRATVLMPMVAALAGAAYVA